VDKGKSKNLVLNSDACFHICNQKEMFTDYEEQVVKVESVDGGDLHIKDIGSVRLKMHDGRMTKLI